jgi:thioredoxin
MADPELEAIRARRLQELMKATSSPKVLPVEIPPSGRPIVVTDATFDQEVSKPGLVLVDFWAAWCGPCLRVSPVLEQIARDRAGSLRLAKLNVDENPRTPSRFQIMSIPTMLLFKDGKLVDGIVGLLPRPQIEATINRWT